MTVLEGAGRARCWWWRLPPTPLRQPVGPGGRGQRSVCEDRAVSAAQLQPYDAVLLVSFGGPERSEDVVPFLRNVTRGRGIPDERLAEVATHYHHFGGRSPINDQNRALLAELRRELAPRPVYWGNRNWDPFLIDALRSLQADGMRRVACFFTAAYASYSSCRQYRENLADAT